MKLNRTPNPLDRNARNGENENWDIIEGEIRKVGNAVDDFIGTVTDEVVSELVDKAKLDWKEPVNNFNSLPSSAQKGDTRMDRSTGKVYRYDGDKWVEIQQIDAGPVNELDSRLTSQLADTEGVINVKAHGAKGDGTTDDWQAIQSAISLAETTGRSVYIPSGKYYVSQTLRTQHMRTYNYTEGIRIFGNGKDSVILGKRELLPADYFDITKLSEQSLLAIHGSNNIVEKLAFEGGKIGLYLGQDPDKTAGSSASMNIIRDLWFYYNGTGIMLQHGNGTHYNKFSNLHIAHAQIGIHLQKGWMIDRTNNNRNVFENIRASRAWIGYLVEDGDGNFFNKVYAETIQASQAIGGEPSQLPAELEGTPSAIVVTGGQYNTFDNFAHEACDWDIYSTGFRTSFTNGMIKDDTTASAKVLFPNPVRNPLSYSANAVISGNMQFQNEANIIFNGAAGTSFGRALFDRHSDGSYHEQTIDLRSLCTQMVSRTSSSRSRFSRLGGICKWLVNYRFGLDPNMDPDDALKILIPLYDTHRLNIGYTEATTGNQTFPMKVLVSSSNPPGEEVWARFSTPEEATTFGGEHLIIPAPSGGWRTDTNTNYLFFRLEFETR